METVNLSFQTINWKKQERGPFMTNDELSRYILHYVKEDRTHSAIMLTAGWGAGKSYYIKNELVPFLGQKEQGNIQCIIVSLYGLTQLSEISKSIYIESRLKIFKPDSERKTAAGLTAKTILKGVSGFFGINLEMPEEELSRLYESIDLSGKLIILEDLERTQINILEVLGFVNSLVEQDNVKVLLVANERELIKYKPATESVEGPRQATVMHITQKQSKEEYTEETQRYLAAKEKTINDTIIFDGDLPHALRQIMRDFDNPVLSQFISDGNIDALCTHVAERNVYNLRSFIFACQKSVDLFQQLGLEPGKNDLDFAATIFLGILKFTLRYKKGEIPRWEVNQSFSTQLGDSKYPLFRFCYDYIVRQHFEMHWVENGRSDLKEFRLYDKEKSCGDEDLQILYAYYLHTEDEVLAAVEAVTKKLENSEFFAFQEYGRIAYYLISIHRLLGCDITHAKELLVANLYNKSRNIRPEFIFAIMLDKDNTPKEVVEEYKDLHQKMLTSLNAKGETIFDFDYHPESIASLQNAINKNEGFIFQDGAFASRLDMDKVAEMLRKCTAAEINTFRYIFHSLYHTGNIREFLGGDKASVEQLYQHVIKLKDYSEYDKIQKLQISYFIKNLEDILTRL